MSEGVTIVGSYNVGLFLKGKRLPVVGETVVGDQFHEGGGGKGSNQAVAASMLGGRTRFIGCIGCDKYGSDALRMYRTLSIQTDMIRVDATTHTGISVILIDDAGQNLISVVPGANYSLAEPDIDAAREAIGGSRIVGFQLENRLEVIDYAIRKAHEWGTQTLLDPAPAARLSESLYPCLDFIKPNETEATTLTGIRVDGVASAVKAGEWLIKRGVRTAIITLGEQGAVCVTSEGAEHFPTPRVQAVDTTGAGDVFSGALMVGISRGEPLEDVVRFANCAAALSVTRLGVIEAIPTFDDVLAFMKSDRTQSGVSVCQKCQPTIG